LAQIRSVRGWKWWSPHHIATATFFARQAALLEATAQNSPLREEFWIGMYAYVTEAVLASTHFLEALINELFAAADDPKLFGYMGGGEESIRIRLASVGSLHLRGPIMERFQLALATADLTLFDSGRQPYQGAADVIRLRNQWVHYRPQWVEPAKLSGGDPESAHWLAAKAAPGPAVPLGMTDVLDKYIGSPLASWACKNCLSLADDFFGRFGMEPVYAKQRDLHVLPK
jgi:hypothetical protein